MQKGGAIKKRVETKDNKFRPSNSSKLRDRPVVKSYTLFKNLAMSELVSECINECVHP